MNNILIFVEVLFVFGAVVCCYKLFGKQGMITWVPIATILANIITAKNATVFGLNTAIGTVMFASTFLATDVLSECHSKQDAKTAVYMGLFADVILILATQISLRYIPSEFDYAHDAMYTLFSLNLRISISSAVMYLIANLADIYLFNRIKIKTGSKKLWLRNNVSTILCNCLENFGFIGIAFFGIYDIKTIITIAISTSIVEAIVALLDTPFLYLAVYKKINLRRDTYEIDNINNKVTGNGIKINKGGIK